ncbi:MAG: EAL domain-containing protein [Bacillota bacterium]|nr:EAL domain-containing protein [Bacillota bacterium]
MFRKEILVVEDNQINRFLLNDILSTKYNVIEAENGKEALEVLKNTKDEISLILLDIIMPVMDGYEFLSIIKADPAYASIPVIVTTQSDSESDEVNALSHGAADFVAKPYKPQIILHRVASIINLRETAAIANQFQYDRLTGLYSKEYFYIRAKELIAQYPQEEFDIICSDIENFKLINDAFGVAAGDHLLQEIAKLYREKVGDKGLCSHFNADQFVCMIKRFPNYTDDLFLETRDTINSLSDIKNIVMKWGIYEIRDKGLSVEKMCDRALLAAQSIKGKYGKHYATYDHELRDKLLREQAITDGMEAALENEEFLLYLQPKYRIRDHKLSGAEALVRWEHPELGFLSPGEFIPVFEKNGFITKMDRYIWDKACAILRSWLDKGYPQLPISVNVSRADIYQIDLTDILLETVEKYKLPPSLLHLEITESAYAKNPEQIINVASQLRSFGFVIEMDDFGSGYSSLNMLNKMSLDILKLDMQFIRNETAKPVNQGILRFIMDLARWMELSVVAEGVETQEQLEHLQAINCDFAQGYYFAKPMPYRDFEGLILQANTIVRKTVKAKEQKKGYHTIVVIDEDALYFRQVREALERKFNVKNFRDSASALTYIEENPQDIAAVVLNLNLEDSQGVEVLGTLKKEKLLAGAPIIATAPQDEHMEELAFTLGANDFAAKPHTGKSLEKRITAAIGINTAGEREKVLRDEAYRDYLTGLLNRRGMAAALDPRKEQDLPLAVYLFDLDNLKKINDSAGHEEGDKLLKSFSSLLGVHTRKKDIICRFGGDEFVVIIKQMWSKETAIKKGEEICEAFKQNHIVGDIPPSCSVGLVLSDNIEDDLSCKNQTQGQLLPVGQLKFVKQLMKR